MENEELKKLRNEIDGLVAKYADGFYSNTSFEPGITNVPPSGKLLGKKELQLMVQASLDGWLTTGRFNKEFEDGLAKYLGLKHLLTVNSGSSANLVAFSTLTSEKLGHKAIKKGDEVITVAAGFPTTVNPIVQFGAVPVFVDIDIKTHNIDVSLIEAAISSKTKAIMLAHTLGNPFNVEIVKEICLKNNLWLVEDCCDALGSTFDGKMVGTWGDIGTLSFYPAHHITMGEGGAVFTNHTELKKIAESFRDWGRDCYCDTGCDNTCGIRFGQKFGELPYGYDHKYVYSHLGYNLKITDMQAACGVAQLSHLDDFIKKRKENFSYLRNRLHSLSEFLEIMQPTEKSDPSWFGCALTIKNPDKIRRVDLLRYLDQHNIGTRLLFAGNLTKQPSFSNVKYRISGSLVNTDKSMNNTFWVGVQPALSVIELDYICDTLEEYFGVGF